MNRMPRMMLTITSSACVSVMMKESMMFSTFVTIGSRHAVLNQEHSLRMYPAPSSPMVPSIGMLRALSAMRNTHSGRTLSVRRYKDSNAR